GIVDLEAANISHLVSQSRYDAAIVASDSVSAVVPRLSSVLRRYLRTSPPPVLTSTVHFDYRLSSRPS
ncbi:hypothetical protein LINPERPRIM_LOCUS4859, partial [Linum perenne]